jgi:anti-sigma regulatory factor (Ser/Thr protein kinase)
VADLTLAALASAPFWARCQTRTVLRGWEVHPGVIETAELLVSELVTNAAKFAGLPAARLSYSELAGVQRISLALRYLPGRLIIEVVDPDPEPPVLADPAVDAEGGRGLLLVAALSKEWDYFLSPAGGKTVFCVIELPPRPDAEISHDSRPAGGAMNSCDLVGDLGGWAGRP